MAALLDRQTRVAMSVGLISAAAFVLINPKHVGWRIFLLVVCGFSLADIFVESEWVKQRQESLSVIHGYDLIQPARNPIRIIFAIVSALILTIIFGIATWDIERANPEVRSIKDRAQDIDKQPGTDSVPTAKIENPKLPFPVPVSPMEPPKVGSPPAKPTKKAMAFASELIVTKVESLPLAVGQPIGANIFYTNEGPSTLSLQAYGGMDVREGVSIEKEEDRRNLEEIVWTAFVDDIKKGPSPPHMPVPPHMVLHVTAPGQLVVWGGRTFENQIIYFVALLRYEDAAGVHETDVCWFAHNKLLEPLFICREHNGPVKPSF